MPRALTRPEGERNTDGEPPPPGTGPGPERSRSAGVKVIHVSRPFMCQGHSCVKVINVRLTKVKDTETGENTTSFPIGSEVKLASLILYTVIKTNIILIKGQL